MQQQIVRLRMLICQVLHACGHLPNTWKVTKRGHTTQCILCKKQFRFNIASPTADTDLTEPFGILACEKKV